MEFYNNYIVNEYAELIQIKIEHVNIGYFDIYTKGGKIRRLFIPKKLRDETKVWLIAINRESGYPHSAVIQYHKHHVFLSRHR